ncbi:MAG: hypothetical protein ABJB74_07825 [Gemmatimonas sp.]
MPITTRGLGVITPFAIVFGTALQTASAQTSRLTVIESATPLWTAATALKVDARYSKHVSRRSPTAQSYSASAHDVMVA